MAEELRRDGKDVTLLVLDETAHEGWEDEAISALMAVSDVFLASCLGGPAEPFGTSMVRGHARVTVGGERLPGLAAAVLSPHPPDVHVEVTFDGR